jgi:predicted DNA-binding transcriptional regulator AlpA
MSNEVESAFESVLRRVIRQELEALRRSNRDDDRLLTAEEAAKILSVSPDWLYRNSKRLPFTKKIHHKMIRFSLQGIQKYIAEGKRF